MKKYFKLKIGKSNEWVNYTAPPPRLLLLPPSTTDTSWIGRINGSGERLHIISDYSGLLPEDRGVSLDRNRISP